jgi:hypothetical protein
MLLPVYTKLFAIFELDCAIILGIVKSEELENCFITESLEFGLSNEILSSFYILYFVFCILHFAFCILHLTSAFLFAAAFRILNFKGKDIIDLIDHGF